MSTEFNSDYLTNGSKERFKELEEKGHDWRSFYSGWLEGRVKMWEDYRGGYSLQQVSDAWDACEKNIEYYRLSGLGELVGSPPPDKEQYLSTLTPAPASINKQIK